MAWLPCWFFDHDFCIWHYNARTGHHWRTCRRCDATDAPTEEEYAKVAREYLNFMDDHDD
jgi:hypothetical protein